jgi:hypothetical protein
MGCRRRRRSGSGVMTGHGSSSRASRTQRGTITMQGLRHKPGRASTSSSTTNCLTELAKHTDTDQATLTLHTATSAV